MKLEVHTPSAAKPDHKLPVVIFWHGGSWQRGGLWRYRFVGRAFARMGVVAVLVGYRKYPQVRYPTFVQDAAQAIKWVHSHIATYGGDPSRLIVAGHSAGAHTAAALAYQPGYWQKTKLDRSILKGCIALSGPFDFDPRPDLRPIFPLDDPAEPWRVGKNLPDRLAPCLVVHGYLDPIVNLKYPRLFVERFRAAGGAATVVYRPVEHLLTLFSFAWPLRLLPWSTWRATRKFIHQVTG